MWAAITRDIAAATGEAFQARERQCVVAGCIDTAYRTAAGIRRYFVKINAAAMAATFAAKAAGLAAIAATHRARPFLSVTATTQIAPG